MIDRKYYDMMEIYTVETLRDVFEYAFVDCPKKQQYMDLLLPLNEGGVSTAKKIEPPKDFIPPEKSAQVKPEPEPEIVAFEEPKEERVVEVEVEVEGY